MEITEFDVVKREEGGSGWFLVLVVVLVEGNKYLIDYD